MSSHLSSVNQSSKEKDQKWKQFCDDTRSEYVKRSTSHLGVCPSVDLSSEQYERYLQYAAAVELENDIILQGTYNYAVNKYTKLQ